MYGINYRFSVVCFMNFFWGSSMRWILVTFHYQNFYLTTLIMRFMATNSNRRTWISNRLWNECQFENETTAKHSQKPINSFGMASKTIALISMFQFIVESFKLLKLKRIIRLYINQHPLITKRNIQEIWNFNFTNRMLIDSTRKQLKSTNIDGQLK